MIRSLRSARTTGLHRYYEAVRLCAPHRYSGPRGFNHLGNSLSRPAAGNPATGPAAARDDRFPRSMQEPEPGSRHLHAGRHPGSKQVSPRLIPGQDPKPGFRHRLRAFDTSSVDRLRSPSWLTPDALTGAPFPNDAQHERLLTAAPRGGLEPPPAGRLRRAKPAEKSRRPPRLSSCVRGTRISISFSRSERQRSTASSSSRRSDQ